MVFFFKFSLTFLLLISLAALAWSGLPKESKSSQVQTGQLKEQAGEGEAMAKLSERNKSAEQVHRGRDWLFLPSSSFSPLITL